jgi:hypothetical protein
MKTIYLAAALALCAQAHVDCRKMDSLDFELKINDHSGNVGTVGVPWTGPRAISEAVTGCQQQIISDKINSRGGRTITVGIDKSIRAVPMYIYEMYDGRWGTSFNCVKEKLTS